MDDEGSTRSHSALMLCEFSVRQEKYAERLKPLGILRKSGGDLGGRTAIIGSKFCGKSAVAHFLTTSRH